MTKTNTIIWLIVLVIILVFVNFANFKETVPSNYDEMSAWQLLDVKIDFDNQIQTLKNNRQVVIDKYNIKRWRANTGTTVVEKNVETKDNKELGLQ